jgi:hypothetical protein
MYTNIFLKKSLTSVLKVGIMNAIHNYGFSMAVLGAAICCTVVSLSPAGSLKPEERKEFRGRVWFDKNG